MPENKHVLELENLTSAMTPEQEMYLRVLVNLLISIQIPVRLKCRFSLSSRSFLQVPRGKRELEDSRVAGNQCYEQKHSSR